jgi:putative tryptophan/tyrosine transport system substrate-binding protein
MTQTRRSFLQYATLVLASPAVAQTPGRKYRIGFLSPADGRGPNHAAFIKRLAELGFRDGDNAEVIFHFAKQQFNLLPDGAKELLSKNVDIIATQTQAAAIAAKGATSTIPIVFMGVRDPIVAGLVTSMNRPGANITGVTLTTSNELITKQVDLFRDLIPNFTKLGVLYNPTNVIQRQVLASMHALLKDRNIEVFDFGASHKDHFAIEFDKMPGSGIHGLMTLVDPLNFQERAQIARLALDKRIPTSFEVRENVDVGGLFSYGLPYIEHWENGATYVVRILNGAKAGDLPVVQPHRFEVVLNMKTAKALEINVPPSVMVLATDIIE